VIIPLRNMSAAPAIRQPGARIRAERVERLPRELGEEGNNLVVARPAPHEQASE
jgi:hypothetical protein